MAKEAKGEMFSSTCRAEQNDEHRTKGDLTFSKTSISIMQPLPKNDFRKATKVDGENRTRDKVANANEMTKDVNVSLTVSRNQNASISASCFFPHKQHSAALPKRATSAEEDKKAPFIGQQKRPLLKVVEIAFEENIRQQKFLPLAKSACWEKKDGHWQSKKRDDYRVVSLDVKPIPGRLEDFIPEIEREQHNGMRGISRRNQTVLDNQKSGNSDQQKSGIILGNKGGMDDEAPLERDECGRVLIPPEEWRKFLAEQRPQTSVPLKTRLQIIHSKDKYNITSEREKPKIIVAESSVKDARNIATFQRQKFSKWS